MGKRDHLSPADMWKKGYLVFLLEFPVYGGNTAIDRYKKWLTANRQFREPFLNVIDHLTNLASIGKRNLQFLSSRHLSLYSVETYGNHHHVTLSTSNRIDFCKARENIPVSPARPAHGCHGEMKTRHEGAGDHGS